MQGINECTKSDIITRKNIKKFFIDSAVRLQLDGPFSSFLCADTRCVHIHQGNEDSGTRLAAMMYRQL